MIEQNKWKIKIYNDMLTDPFGGSKVYIYKKNYLDSTITQITPLIWNTKAYKEGECMNAIPAIAGPIVPTFLQDLADGLAENDIYPKSYTEELHNTEAELRGKIQGLESEVKFLRSFLTKSKILYKGKN